jgi:betaine-aldehyde dehydrogenase
MVKAGDGGPDAALARLLRRKESLFIAGAWRRPAAPEPIEVVDPSTGEGFARIDGCGAADAGAAADAAVAAFPAWRRTSGAERAAFLDAFAAGLEARRGPLVHLQMLNNGKPRGEAEIDVGDAVATFRYYARLARALDARQGEAVDLPDPAFRGKTRLEPIGPAGMIVPWNFPLVTSAWKLAPALAAGCTVVLKTSEFTPLAELVYADIAGEAGLAPGVLNIVTGGASAGAAIAAHPHLAKLSFTGSNQVGRRVMAAAAERTLPVSLELGGKSPIVVLADADPDRAAACIAAGIFFNCGQMCSATSRLVIDEAVADAVLERLARRAETLEVGSPFAEGTEMGPLSNAPQAAKVRGILEAADRRGLSRLSPPRPVGAPGGFFVPPTIYLDVPQEDPVWREEIFGPVLAVRRFSSEAEAVSLANDSAFGLVATIVSGDGARAERMAAGIDAGHVWINSEQVIFPQTAWGGFKASGIGRELGPWGLSAWLGVKHLTIAGSPS